MTLGDPDARGTEIAAEGLRADLHRLIDTVDLDPSMMYLYVSDLATIAARTDQLAGHLGRLTAALTGRDDVYHDESGSVADTLTAAAVLLEDTQASLADAAAAAGRAAGLLSHLGHR